MTSTRTETQTSTAGKSPGPAKLNKDPTIAQIFETLEYGPAPEAASSVNSWLDEHGRDFGHFVNGKWVKPEGRKVYETRNPTTGQRFLCNVRFTVTSFDLPVPWGKGVTRS